MSDLFEEQNKAKKEEIIFYDSKEEELVLKDNEYMKYLESHSDYEYKYDSSKSVSRNYRDYEIYKAISKNKDKSFKEIEDASMYIQRKVAGCVPSENVERIEKALLNICKNSFMRNVGNDVIKKLAEHLLVGLDYKNGEDPNAISNMEMFSYGKLALKELYIRQMIQIEKKYGKKLVNMSPTEYLKNRVAIDHDLSCINDMTLFFNEYKEEEESDEVLALAKKAKYYSDVLEILEYRSEIYTRNIEGDINSKGELSREKLTEIRELKSELEKEAKDSDVSRKLKHSDVNLDMIFQNTESRKEKALSAIERGKDALEEALGNQREADDLAERIDDENASLKLDAISKSFRKVKRLMMLPDDSFISKYPEMIAECSRFKNDFKQVMNNDYFANLKEKYGNLKEEDALNAPHEDQAKIEIYKEYQNIINLVDAEECYKEPLSSIKNRIDNIAKHGHTEGESLYSGEILLDKSSRKILDLKKEKTEVLPKSLIDMKAELKAPIFKVDSFDEKGVYKLLETISEIKRYKEFNKGEYVLSQPHDEFLKCEFYLENEELIRETFNLRLRLLHIDDKFQFRIMKDGYEADKARFNENITRLAGIFSDKTNKIIISEDRNERKEYARDLLEKNLTSYKDKKKEIRKTLSELEVDEKVRDFLEDSNGYVFLSKLPKEKEPAYNVAKATLLEDVKALKELGDYRDELIGSGNVPDKKVPDKKVPDKKVPYDSFMRMFDLYNIRVKQVADKLKRDGEFSDHGFFTNRREIEEICIMGDFLSKNAKSSGIIDDLIKKYEGDDKNLELLTDLENFEKTDKLFQTFIKYSNFVFLCQVSRDCENIEMFTDKGYEKLDRNAIEKAKVNLRNKSRNKIEAYRRSYYRDAHKEEIKASNRREFLKNAVGKELTAMERRRKTSFLHSLASPITSLFGSCLQALSWWNRTKRTDNHGEERYDECKSVFANKLGDIEEFQKGKIPKLDSGDAGFTPDVNLGTYYESNMKKKILKTLNEEKTENFEVFREFGEDSFVGEFKKALEAIELFSMVTGIVNSDTTEMEMAFIDTFKKSMNRYIEGVTQTKAEIEDNETKEIIEERIRILKELNTTFDTATKGLLDTTIDKDVLDEINANTISYVEDTTYSKNMDESNIKDIPLFLHEPNMNDVKQSTIGDCWLLSSLLAVVKMNPDFIRSMFHDLGDGNVLVRLYSPVGNDEKYLDPDYQEFKKGTKLVPVYFKVKKHYETGYGNASDCTWVQLFEKAYALGGFNGRNVAKVRGNRLYNVADELTSGSIGKSISIITGKITEKTDVNKDIKNEEFFGDIFVSGLIAGLDTYEGDIVKRAVEEIKNMSEEQKKQGDDKYFNEDLIISDINRFIVKEAQNRVLEDLLREDTEFNNSYLKEGLSEDDKMAILFDRIEALWTKVKENYDTMKSGKPLKFAEHQVELEGRQQISITNERYDKKKASEVTKRKRLARYFENRRSHDLSDDSEYDSFIADVSYCIQNKGVIVTGNGHCIDIIDISWKHGSCFLLIREPFNVYKTRYRVDEDERIERKDSGLGSVIMNHEKSRKLIGDKKEILEDAFGATCWYLAADIFKLTTDAYMTFPSDVTIPDHRIK